MFCALTGSGFICLFVAFIELGVGLKDTELLQFDLYRLCHLKLPFHLSMCEGHTPHLSVSVGFRGQRTASAGLNV